MIDHKVSQQTLVSDIATVIYECDDIQRILQILAEKVRAFLAVDRIKIYQFAADGSGKVIAEAILDDKLPALQGLHFPATDIPTPMRQQFAEIVESVVIDVSAKRKSLRYTPASQGGTGVETAVSESYQSADPCHLQYLLNMGVLTSLSTPILYRNVLWGLLVAHHSEPRRFTHHERQTIELVTKEISLGIAQKELFHQVERHQQVEAFLLRLNQSIERESFKTSTCEKLLAETVAIFAADGAYLYLTPGLVQGLPQSYVKGLQTPITHLDIHPPWQTLIQGDSSDYKNTTLPPPQVYLLSALVQDETSYKALAANNIGSLLLIPIRSQHQWLGSLILFRQEREFETIWAGQNHPDERNTMPRQSFKSWCQHQRQTPDWHPEDIQLGRKVGAQLCTALVHQFLANLIDYQASHDTLTQLPNAEFFRGRLVLALEQTIEQGELLAVIMIDLNNFKRVNDAMGVSAGDQLLGNVGKRLRAYVDPDAVDRHLLARWHGDCFILLLPNHINDSETIYKIKRQCRHCLCALRW